MDAYLTGIFPRSERLIAATRGLDRNRVTPAEVDAQRQRDLEGLVQLQRDAGFGYLTDGQLNWQDLCRPLVEAWEGMSAGGLERWFDNNNFIRQPLIEGDIRARPLASQYFPPLPAPEEIRRKAVLPGPYTFSVLSEAESPWETRIEAISLGLHDACAELKRAGFAHVQLSDPSLVVDPPTAEGMATVRGAYDAIDGGHDLELSLHLFFAPAGPALAELLDFPVDIIGLDFYEEDLHELKDIDVDKVLACGALDARNSLLEVPEEVVDLIRTIRNVLAPPDLILCPNADLELLPREVAEEKVRVLGSALTTLRGDS